MRIPLNGTVKVTSKFGPRTHPVTGKPDTHRGVDLVVTDIRPDWTIYAPEALTVRKTGFDGATGGGNFVIALGTQSGQYHYFLHLQSINVVLGQNLSEGDKVGIMGSTGTATGRHLHWGIRKTVSGGYENPATYFPVLDSNGSTFMADSTVPVRGGDTAWGAQYLEGIKQKYNLTPGDESILNGLLASETSLTPSHLIWAIATFGR